MKMMILIFFATSRNDDLDFCDIDSVAYQGIIEVSGSQKKMTHIIEQEGCCSGSNNSHSCHIQYCFFRNVSLFVLH